MAEGGRRKWREGKLVQEGEGCSGGGENGCHADGLWDIVYSETYLQWKLRLKLPQQMTHLYEVISSRGWW